MPFDLFQSKIGAICKRFGVTAEFYHDEHGRHVARLPDGGVIYGNSASSSVTYVDVNHNHRYMAAIA